MKVILYVDQMVAMETGFKTVGAASGDSATIYDTVNIITHLYVNGSHYLSYTHTHSFSDLPNVYLYCWISCLIVFFTPKIWMSPYVTVILIKNVLTQKELVDIYIQSEKQNVYCTTNYHRYSELIFHVSSSFQPVFCEILYILFEYTKTVKFWNYFCARWSVSWHLGHSLYI